VPFDCQHRQTYGPDVCLAHCRATAERGGCAYARVERAGDLPPADPDTIDVALLDMHHGWPNLGHDALVHGVQNAVCDLQPDLAAAGLRFRVLSYDVRRGAQIPEGAGGRHAIYVGTGGPGHLDPARNDGRSPGSQGILEDPRWETPLFRLFDGIRADEDAVLLAVCHTFGVMCRWLGVAEAVLRGPDKGGKSAGILENMLTAEAAEHPWFGRLSRELPDWRRLRVLDSRLYDLVPRGGPLPEGVVVIAHETLGVGGPRGEAITMIEFARDADGVMPRIFGVNHHPEIVNRPRQLMILRKRMERGEVTPEWYAERVAALTEDIHDHGDRALRVTSSFTLLAPLRYYLHREATRRAERLGRPLVIDPLRAPILFRASADQLQIDDSL
jgi:hypothetical protein